MRRYVAVLAILALLLPVVAMAAVGLTTASLTAENTFCTAVVIKGKFNFSLSGTWAATVFLQRSFDSGTSWLDIASYTANTQLVGEEVEAGVRYRFGVKTGGYTSGTVVGRISY